MSRSDRRSPLTSPAAIEPDCEVALGSTVDPEASDTGCADVEVGGRGERPVQDVGRSR